MNAHDRRVLFSAMRDNWRTPAKLRAALEKEFGALIDVSDRRWGDAMRELWPSVWYANPPYGPAIPAWLDRAVTWRAGHRPKSSDVGVMLLPARTDTKWWHDLAVPNVDEIRFVRGRLHFDERGAAPFPSVLLVFRRLPERP